VEAGLDVDWHERASASVGAQQDGAVGILAIAVEVLIHTIDIRLRIQGDRRGQQSRLSAACLRTAVSRMGRDDYRYADVPELLRFTLMMFYSTIGANTPIKLVTDDLDIPKILCYAGDLNQV
jgi:hypothetical protein